MKTTVELSTVVLSQARRTAKARGITLRELIERGLRLVLEEEQGARHYRLPDRSVKGKGLRPELAGASWEELRGLAYEGRGG